MDTRVALHLSLFTFRCGPAGRNSPPGRGSSTAAVPGGRYRVPCNCAAAPCLSCTWGRPEGDIRRLPLLAQREFCRTVDRLMTKWEHLLTRWRGECLAERAAVYADAICRQKAPLQTCVGFIDGTAIHVARQGGGLQCVCYSGHKRRHVLKFQSVTAPDGLVFHKYDPHEGRRHDMVLYYESGLDDDLRQTLLIDGVQHCLHGDSAYVLRAWMQTGHWNRPDRTAAEPAFDLFKTASARRWSGATRILNNTSTHSTSRGSSRYGRRR